MNIYDSAHQLARTIKNSNEYKEFKKHMKEVKKDKKASKLLEDLRNKQLELQRSQVLGEQIDQNKINKLEELYKIASSNPKLSYYLQSELRFMQTMEDINKILAEAVEVDYK
jgi:cell fate (sporulation/competence/biofilm development) regulator YlbF (YheA/YmcA/DUF963 family)